MASSLEFSCCVKRHIAVPAEHFNTSATCITTTITTTAYCTFPVITATIAVTTDTESI